MMPAAKNALRVLHVIAALAPSRGGPSRSVPDLCRALTSAGIDVTLAALWNSREGATVRQSDEQFSLKLVETAFRTAQFPSVAFVRMLGDACRHSDLVHIHSLWNPVTTIAAMLARRSGVPYVISPRGMLQDTSMSRRRWKKDLYYAVVDRRTVPGAAGLHFLSDEELRRSTLIDPRRQIMIVVPNGVDGDLRSSHPAGQFRRQFSIPNDKRVMLFVGRLHWSKGLDLQAESFVQVAKRREDVVWVIIGKDEGVMPAIRRRVDEAGLANRVFLTGELQRQHCLSALRDADVFVLSSRHEAHSVALNEAMAMGAPCVVTESVGFKWLAEYGAGIETENTAASLAEGICNVLESTRNTNARVQSARRLVDEKLSWPKVAEQMIRGYEAVLSGG